MCDMNLGAKGSVLQELWDFLNLYSANSAYFVNIQQQYFFSIHCRHVPHILKMCMNNYNTEKVIFDKFTSFFNIAIS